MTLRTDTLALQGLMLSPGEGRRLELFTAPAPLELAGERYRVVPELVPVRLGLSLTTGSGYALRLRFRVDVAGPCMRCLEAAEVTVEVDAREVSQPGGVEELESPYVVDGVLEVAAWAHDALALALPAAVVCRRDCAGLCPVCGVSLNAAGEDHHHEPPRDPRLQQLSEIVFEPPADD
jgi:uncharacterized protein